MSTDPHTLPPTLIATKGHPASGKSVVAEMLARRMRWALIDKDDIKDHILVLPDANEKAYAIMWQIAGMQLALGISVIAVSPLSYPAEYTMAVATVHKHDARLLVLETVVDESEWRRRLNARGPGYSAHKISGWAAMEEKLRQYGGCWQYPIDPAHHLVLDTGRPAPDLIDQVLARLGGDREPPGLRMEVS